ncbi:hypothetical protein EDB85DRAFT_2147315 [Lactarius pseudohatsudake]|nr:hypothetical protein EDB85DRAFT_2147315 [Lactarius pseudohatsudake]
MVAPSLHGRRRSLRAADSRRGRVAVAPWPCRGCAVVVSCVPCHHRAVVAPSSRVIPSSRQFAQSVVVVRVVVVRLAPHRVRRRVGSGGGGLRSESTCGSGVGDLSPRRRLRLHLAAHKPVAAASNPSPRTSPPPPPPLTARKSRRNATSARCARTAATPLPHGAQEPPQRHLRTARNPHRYDTDTNDDGDAAAGNSTEAGTMVMRRREQHGGRNDGDAGEADDDGDGV